MEITTLDHQSSPTINESFSHSWVTNLKPPIDIASDYINDESSSFIEMDPRLPPSKRFIRSVPSDFGFDFPVSESPLGLVHADQLISNGFLVPLFVRDDNMKIHDVLDCNYYSTSTTSSTNHKTTARVRCSSLRRCRRMSKRFFQKYLIKFLLWPFLYGRRRKGHNQFDNQSGGGGDMRIMETTLDWGLSATSARTSLACSSADENWRRSCDSESSIYEAVLHCKRTHQSG